MKLNMIALIAASLISSCAMAATPLQIAQQAYLKASNPGSADQFAHAVAISGDTIVVGAEWEDSNATGVNGAQTNNSATDSGAAYIFVRSGTNWVQQAYLKASNTTANDRFGYAVAISGNTVVVAAVWEDSNATGVNGNQTNNNAPDSGAAYVFVRSGTNWTQEAYLKASNAEASDLFGDKVAISGDTIVVSAFWEDSNATGVNGNQSNNSASNSGAAYVFVRSGGSWTQQAYLKASNTEANDAFFFVTISRDTIVVGAPWEDSNATGVNGNQSNNSASNSGAAYVFVRSGTTWTQQAYLKASNTQQMDGFFFAAVSGDTIVVGARNEDSNASGVNGNQTNNTAVSAGAAYIFVREGTNWSQQAYLKASNTGAGDEFGWAVAIENDLVVIGAHNEDSNATGVNGDQNNNSFSNSGAAYVFAREGTNWTQQAYLKASNTGAGDEFGGEALDADGTNVAIGGDTIVVGASYEDSNAPGVNGDQTNNGAGNSGAAYVFTGVCPSCLTQKPVRFQLNSYSLTFLQTPFGTPSLGVSSYHGDPASPGNLPNYELQFAPGAAMSHRGVFFYQDGLSPAPVEMEFTVDVPLGDSNNNGMRDILEFSLTASGRTVGQYIRPDGAIGTFSTDWDKPANSHMGTCAVTFDFGPAFTNTIVIYEYRTEFPMTAYWSAAAGKSKVILDMTRTGEEPWNTLDKVTGELALRFESGKITVLSESSLERGAQGFEGRISWPFKWNDDSPSTLNRGLVRCSLSVIDGNTVAFTTPEKDFTEWNLLIVDPNDNDDDGLPNIVDDPSRAATPPVLDIGNLYRPELDGIRLLIYGDVGRTYILENAVGSPHNWLNPTPITISSYPHMVDLDFAGVSQQFWRMRFP